MSSKELITYSSVFITFLHFINQRRKWHIDQYHSELGLSIHAFLSPVLDLGCVSQVTVAELPAASQYSRGIGKEAARRQLACEANGNNKQLLYLPSPPDFRLVTSSTSSKTPMRLTRKLIN